MYYDIQKAPVTKRIGAFLLDFMLLVILIVFATSLLTPAMNVNKHIENIKVITDEIEENKEYYEEKYQLKLDITDEEFNTMTEEEKIACNEAWSKMYNETGLTKLENKVVSLYILAITCGALIAILLTEVLVPALMKHGRTLGKRAFGLAVMRKNCVKIHPVQMVARALLGKFTICLMFPIYAIVFFGLNSMPGKVILVVVLGAQLIAMGVSKNNAAIHDLIVGTTVVDYDSQMIYENQEELLAAIEKDKAERAARKTY